MRLLRIRLAHFRGVEAREVVLARDGVTVIEGPNEVGKSTLIEALDLLIDYRDDSGDRRVKAVQPVGQDVGPEVEVELETGPYRLVYRKRFIRDRLTELRVTAPRQEAWSGREAHDRVNAILTETLDVPLWKALRITQGAALSPAMLRDARSLASALDRAAGTVAAGPAELTLIDRAQEEYRRYWTDTGRPVKWRTDEEEALTAARRAVAEVDEQLRAVDAEVTEVARHEAQLPGLRARRIEAVELLASLDERRRAVDELARQVETLAAREATARLAWAQARDAEAARRDAVRARDERTAERDRLAASIAARAGERGEAGERAERARAALEVATAARAAAASLARRRRDDATWLREQAEHDRLAREVAEARAAREAITAERALIDANPVDDALLEAILAADGDLRVAKAQRDAAGPQVTLLAERALELVVDGSPVRLDAGTPLERPVPRRLEVALPGTLAVRIARGSGGEDEEEAIARATDRLTALLARAGATEIAAARERHATRRAAVERGKEARATLDRLLGGTDGAATRTRDAEAALLAELGRREDRVASLAARTAGYLGDRPADPPLATDRDDADRLAAEAGTADERAAATEEQARSAATQATAHLAAIDASTAGDRALLDQAGEELARAEASLATARAAADDAAVAGAAALAAGALATASAELVKARERLAAAGGEELVARHENQRRVVEDSASALDATERRIGELRAGLEVRGERGLAEERDRAVTALDAAERAAARGRARAAAAKLLFETLRDAREAARQAYAEPLRAQIEQLGRILHGPGFAVELDPAELRATRRTLDGRTLDVEQLSAGAKEQLGTIVRLAGAMLVANDGDGVPVLFDDTLGFTDRPRLDAMGAILAVAGRSCQVIVLTCVPERFASIGGATRVML